MTTWFRPTEELHTFDSARDAIDAVSAFESTILIDVSYEITPTADDRWIAIVRTIHPRKSLGYLAPIAPWTLCTDPEDAFVFDTEHAAQRALESFATSQVGRYRRVMRVAEVGYKAYIYERGKPNVYLASVGMALEV